MDLGLYLEKTMKPLKGLNKKTFIPTPRQRID